MSSCAIKARPPLKEPVRVEVQPIKRPAVPGGPTRSVPLGTRFCARSGDKGGNANVGVWARDNESYAWLESFLTAERFKELIPEAANLEVRRYELPYLKSLNFIVVGLLGEQMNHLESHSRLLKRGEIGTMQVVPTHSFLPFRDAQLSRRLLDHGTLSVDEWNNDHSSNIFGRWALQKGFKIIRRQPRSLTREIGFFTHKTFPLLCYWVTFAVFVNQAFRAAQDAPPGFVPLS